MGLPLLPLERLKQDPDLNVLGLLGKRLAQHGALGLWVLVDLDFPVGIEGYVLVTVLLERRGHHACPMTNLLLRKLH